MGAPGEHPVLARTAGSLAPGGRLTVGEDTLSGWMHLRLFRGF